MSRLTVVSREPLIRRHLEEHVPLRALATHAGISLRTAYKGLARYRTGGPSALADRRSGRHSQQWTLDPRQLQQAIDLRHLRCTLRRIARLLQVPLSTVGRAMNVLGGSSRGPHTPQTNGKAERYGLRPTASTSKPS